jgi:hypothetical protein
MIFRELLDHLGTDPTGCPRNHDAHERVRQWIGLSLDSRRIAWETMIAFVPFV